MHNEKLPGLISKYAKQQIRVLDEKLAEYSSDWVDSSQFHDSAGDYSWAASKLPTSGVVLEIGTGSGRSTLNLLRAGNTVVGLDQNRHCLEESRALLCESGYPTEIIYRFSWEPTPGGGVKATYCPLDNPPTLRLGGCLLIEGDVQQVDINGLRRRLTDVGCIDVLKPLGLQHAVCWFPGTGMPLPASPSAGQIDISSYKLHMIRNAFEVAIRLLPPGGYLHLLDRFSPDSSAEGARRIFARHNMNFNLVALDERITSLEGYSGVTLHQRSTEKADSIKIVSLLYQKPEI